VTDRSTVEHRFVETAPDNLDDGVVYVSIPYATALHRCACGCGTEVVTPLSPGGWTLIFDGRSVSLHPSIGNWNFPCRSHYWIRHGRIQWAKSRIGSPSGYGQPVVHVPSSPDDSVEGELSIAGRCRRWVLTILSRLRRGADG
jgi:hypothetical protein